MNIHRGILRNFHGGTWSADVRLLGSISTRLDGIAVSRAIDSAEMVTDRHVGVLFFDESNPKDAVVIAVWT